VGDRHEPHGSAAVRLVSCQSPQRGGRQVLADGECGHGEPAAPILSCRDPPTLTPNRIFGELVSNLSDDDAKLIVGVLRELAKTNEKQTEINITFITAFDKTADILEKHIELLYRYENVIESQNVQIKSAWDRAHMSTRLSLSLIMTLLLLGCAYILTVLPEGYRVALITGVFLSSVPFGARLLYNLWHDKRG
jgi:hypothetical protein